MEATKRNLLFGSIGIIGCLGIAAVLYVGQGQTSDAETSGQNLPPPVLAAPSTAGAVIPQELTEGAQLLYLCFAGNIVDSLSKDANVHNLVVAPMVLSLDGLNGALKMKATEFELLLANSQESEVQLQVRGMNKYLSDEFEVAILLDSCIK